MRFETTIRFSAVLDERFYTDSWGAYLLFGCTAAYREANTKVERKHSQLESSNWRENNLFRASEKT